MFVGFSGGSTTLYNTIFECFKNPSYAQFNKNKSDDKLTTGFFLQPNVSIIGAVVVSMTFDYADTIRTSESSMFGRMLSRVICYKYRQYLVDCAHVHHLMNREVVDNSLKCKYLSEYDSTAYPIFGYQSAREFEERYSSFGIDEVRIPWLAIQPADDLGQSSDLCIDFYTKDKRVIYMIPSHGNHLGFFESDSQRSDTYVPRVAALFGNVILELDN